MRSAPHSQVLAHTDVLVTHGGHGTVMKSLVAGVPIVCMPTGREQPDNAARLVHRGAGVKISKKASPAKIAAAIEHVLDGTSFQTAAARLGAKLRAEADSGAALNELEALAHRRASTTAVRIDERSRRRIPLRLRRQAVRLAGGRNPLGSSIRRSRRRGDRPPQDRSAPRAVDAIAADFADLHQTAAAARQVGQLLDHSESAGSTASS